VLRITVLLTSALILVGAMVLAISGVNGLAVAAGWVGLQALVVLVAVVFERGRYRPTARGSRWTRTAERFKDPSTGRWVAVEYDAQTGERRYVDLPPGQVPPGGE
jgi:hypothetical protein